MTSITIQNKDNISITFTKLKDKQYRLDCDCNVGITGNKTILAIDPQGGPFISTGYIIPTTDDMVISIQNINKELIINTQ